MDFLNVHYFMSHKYLVNSEKRVATNLASPKSKEIMAYALDQSTILKQGPRKNMLVRMRLSRKQG